MLSFLGRGHWKHWRKQRHSPVISCCCIYSRSATLQHLPGLKIIFQSSPLQHRNRPYGLLLTTDPPGHHSSAADTLLTPATAPLSLGSHPLCKLTPLVSITALCRRLQNSCGQNKPASLLSSGLASPSPIRLNQSWGGNTSKFVLPWVFSSVLEYHT